MSSYLPVLFLSLLLILSLCTGCAAAKEEVIYANLDASGNVEGVYAVNIFDVPEKTIITDYGNYTSVKNLVSEEEIVKTGDDTYSIYSGPGKLYYQGNMEPVLPWKFTIRYALNGVWMSPEEIAGKSGRVTIHIRISQDPDGDRFFYRNYALNATVLLDANTCTNIVANGATIANNGSKKQLTYTILPNKVTNLLIEMDSVLFSMDEISINGVRLSMDIDSSSVDMSEINDLKDALENATKAASSLTTGSAKLHNSIKQLPDGVSKLETAATAALAALVLEGGTSVAIPYVTALSDGLATLQSSSEALVSGSRSLMNGTKKLADGLDVLRFRTRNMDEKIVDKINEVIDPLSASGGKVQSFTSKKNTNVERVQFVMHTKAVTVPEPEAPPAEPKKELNFFERVLALFGISL